MKCCRPCRGSLRHALRSFSPARCGGAARWIFSSTALVDICRNKPVDETLQPLRWLALARFAEFFARALAGAGFRRRCG
jgi:hypothetical protein